MLLERFLKTAASILTWVEELLRGPYAIPNRLIPELDVVHGGIRSPTREGCKVCVIQWYVLTCCAWGRWYAQLSTGVYTAVWVFADEEKRVWHSTRERVRKREVNWLLARASPCGSAGQSRDGDDLRPTPQARMQTWRSSSACFSPHFLRRSAFGHSHSLVLLPCDLLSSTSVSSPWRVGDAASRARLPLLDHPSQHHFRNRISRPTLGRHPACPHDSTMDTLRR